MKISFVFLHRETCVLYFLNICTILESPYNRFEEMNHAIHNNKPNMAVSENSESEKQIQMGMYGIAIIIDFTIILTGNVICVNSSLKK